MSFEITPQLIPDVLLIEPTVFADDRGYFKESYNLNDFEEFLPDIKFVQDNESKSSKGVVRGLHFQRAPFAQSKLLRVIQGAIWDVAVDLRPRSKTFQQFCFTELSANNHHQYFVPRGFAHGFIVLSDTAVLAYKTDNFYHYQSEAGIHPHDPFLNIPWPLPKEEHILSSKDKVLPNLSDLISNSVKAV
jgi:dTDP-4-dehydrorhamnose 3,5-epimerase